MRIPKRVQWAVELLGVRPADHILEIGCGPGHAVALICERLRQGTVSAIDRSATMVKRARERNAGCIAAGRARIERQTLNEASLGRRFAKAFAINVNAFWTDPEQSFAGLGRLLERHGTAHLVYEPPIAAGLRELRRSLSKEFEKGGFRVEDVHEQRFTSSVGLCVTASYATTVHTKPRAGGSFVRTR